jgi:hypothetical protein
MVKPVARGAHVADLVTRVQQEIAERLNALRPLVSEYDRLLRAQEALSGTGGDARTAPASARRGARPARSQSTRGEAVRRRAPRGANRQAVLAALGERPGASAGELSGASGVSAPTIYNVLRALTRSGEVQTVALPSGRSGYRLPSPTDDGTQPRKRSPRRRAKTTPAKTAAAAADPVAPAARGGADTPANPTSESPAPDASTSSQASSASGR